MNKNISKIENQKGFTLVEVMIAVGLFVVVMVYGIGSVLSTNTAHKKSQSQRAINDNLSFVIEDMSRNIRLGSNYRCPIGLGSINPTGYEFTANITDATAQDCEFGDESLTLSFDPMNANFDDPADTTDQMGYVINGNAIYKASASTYDGSAHTFIRITPPEVIIDQFKSGFTVIGTETTGTQPRVIVRLSGTVNYKNIVTPFDIQTTLSQRLLEE
jgi:prepilin-type N-terminal cleavage/methylation domain-containing protein